MVICLLLFLDCLIVLDDTFRNINVFLLRGTGIFHDLLHSLFMLCIRITQLTAHCLIEICSIIHIICLCIFQLAESFAKL